MSRELVVTGVKIEVTHTANWVMVKFYNAANNNGHPDFVLDILKLEDLKKFIDSVTDIGVMAFSDPSEPPDTLLS